MENLNESLVTSNPDKSEIPEKEPDNQTKRQRPDNDNGNPESQEVQALEAIALQEAMDPLGALGERVRSFVTENLGEVEREDRTGTEMPCETNKNDEGKRDDLSDDEQMEVEPSDEEKGEEEVGLEYGTSCVVVQAQNGQVVVVTKKQKRTGPGSSAFPMTSQRMLIAS
uniref:Protein Ycf2-like n=1 Tax=Globodera pallida TaxID=36090 RepID=A0A183CLR9_GLOPA